MDATPCALFFKFCFIKLFILSNLNKLRYLISPCVPISLKIWQMSWHGRVASQGGTYPNRSAIKLIYFAFKSGNYTNNTESHWLAWVKIFQDISRHFKTNTFQDISRHFKTLQDKYVSRHFKTFQDISRHFKTRTCEVLVRYIKTLPFESS